MHDHPYMYGFIKCIHGSVNVTSYSPVNQSDTQGPTAGTDLLHIYAHKESDMRLAEVSGDVAVLRPEKGNIHSISAAGGPAAFIDFLIPPYNDGDRDCHYFKVDNAHTTSDIHVLRQINCPSWYHCDSVPYSGPVLHS